MKRQHVREGDWFAVPLREGGYATGVVARKGNRGILLGYFFGPRRASLPTLEDVEGSSPNAPVLIECFSHLGLRDRTWPILGTLMSWNREKWPIPEFCRTEVPSGRTWRVTYADDLAAPIREERCSVEEASKLRPDRLAGAGAIEIRLTELLRDNNDDR